MELQGLWNVGPSQDERPARNRYHALAGAAAGAGRQPTDAWVGDVRADDGVVSRFEFENIRAGTTTGAAGEVGLRTEFSEDHNFWLGFESCEPDTEVPRGTQHDRVAASKGVWRVDFTRTR